MRSRAGLTRFDIEDECGGLPEGAIETLFQPHVSNDRSGRGFGLGLAITRDAIERIGGEIGVTDLPNKGCVFSIALPTTGN